jgi:hypothetical protein
MLCTAVEQRNQRLACGGRLNFTATHDIAGSQSLAVQAIAAVSPRGTEARRAFDARQL